MKDRIRQIMESKHMTQQVFATYVGLSPATLSGIFTGRTNPTMNTVEAIKKKIPDISTDWLMFGTGDMYIKPQQPSGELFGDGLNTGDPILDFENPPAPVPQPAIRPAQNSNSVRNTHPEIVREEIKFVDKPQRRVTEIRVYYDDQTWESFVPSKK